MIESQADYVLNCMHLMDKHRIAHLDPRPEATQRFNRRIQRDMRKMVFSGGCGSWYTDKDDVNFTLWPYSALRFLMELHRPLRTNCRSIRGAHMTGLLANSARVPSVFRRVRLRRTQGRHQSPPVPRWTRRQVPQMMDVMVRMPSGVRMAFSTSATRCACMWATRMVTPPQAPRPAAFRSRHAQDVRSVPCDGGSAVC
jgi:hypothetical protein